MKDKQQEGDGNEDITQPEVVEEVTNASSSKPMAVSKLPPPEDTNAISSKNAAADSVEETREGKCEEHVEGTVEGNIGRHDTNRMRMAVHESDEKNIKQQLRLN